MIGRAKQVRGVFAEQILRLPKKTTVPELLANGYKLRGRSRWTKEQLQLFFESCDRFKKASAVIGMYTSVYDWISYSILKGSKAPHEVQTLANRIYNARRKRKRHTTSDSANTAAMNEEVEDDDGTVHVVEEKHNMQEQEDHVEGTGSGDDDEFVLD